VPAFHTLPEFRSHPIFPRRIGSFRLSERSDRRFRAVREHYEDWQRNNPGKFPEQYMGSVYTHNAGPNPPPWKWIVEYISAVIASAGTPPASLNRNPRYSDRVNRPFYCSAHQQFWNALLSVTANVSVITTNYDILVERVLRHRPAFESGERAHGQPTRRRTLSVTSRPRAASRRSPLAVIDPSGNASAAATVL
jgi:hypothetical protein